MSYACLGKETEPKETGQTSDALEVHFTHFIPWNPEGRQSMYLTSCFLCKRPGPRRTPGRTPDPLISNAHFSTPALQKRSGEGPAKPGRTSDPFARNIRPHCQKKAKPGVWKSCHSKDAEPEGRHGAQPPLVVRGVLRLPRKTQGASEWVEWVK